MLTIIFILLFLQTGWIMWRDLVMMRRHTQMDDLMKNRSFWHDESERWKDRCIRLNAELVEALKKVET